MAESGRKRCVAGCNSGWLSDLENAVRVLLPKLASQERRLDGLSQEEQVLIARWAVKTAFLIHRTAAIPKVIPLEVYRELRVAPAELPRRTFVFAFQDNGEHSIRDEQFADAGLDGPCDL